MASKVRARTAKHKGEIELESFSWGRSQPADMAGSSGTGGGAGKVYFQEAHCTTLVNQSSPTLMLNCATGVHIKSALITARKQGEGQQDYYKVTLTDVLVSSYQASGGGDLIPTDQFSLNFGKIEFSYQSQDEKGKLGTPVKTGYDLKANKKA